MNGFSFDAGRIVFDYAGRRVASTGGTLLQFMTTAQSFSSTISFPDANKVPLYSWFGSVQRAVGDEFLAHRESRSVVGALPQEWKSTVILGAAPAGADMLMGKATLVRTVAPSHTWFGTTIAPATTRPIQLIGSFIMEGTAGLTRSMTIDIESGNLVAKLEQSIGPAAGNFTTTGTVPMTTPTSSAPGSNLNVGWENNAPSGAAFPVWWQDVAPYYINESQAYSGSIAGPGNARNYANNGRYGGSAQVSYADPTNYGSTYSLVVNCRFGRRS